MKEDLLSLKQTVVCFTLEFLKADALGIRKLKGVQLYYLRKFSDDFNFGGKKVSENETVRKFF